MTFFGEVSTKNMVQNGTHPIITQTSPNFMDNPLILGIFSLSTKFCAFKWLYVDFLKVITIWSTGVW